MYCRELVSKHHKRLYIISGPQGEGGTGKHGFHNTIADGRVTVLPNAGKVILVVSDGDGDDIAKVNARTRLRLRSSCRTRTASSTNGTATGPRSSKSNN